MKPERWQQVRTILEAALELPPDKRDDYLDKACADDSSELRKEVDSLLAYRKPAESFLEGPPASGLGEHPSDIGKGPQLVGQTLSHYKILAKRGHGGMGEVYQARDETLGRDVAIKVLRQKWTSDPDRLRRFEQEARSASALNHPNIVTIYEIGEYEGTPFIAMEHVEGETLRDILAEAPLPTKKLLQIATQIGEGLAKAHAARIVHRDLKPENLMVTDDGLVKILDFGLAKLTGPPVEIQSETETKAKVGTQIGTILGTVQYMSPEQASGRSVDHRSDQFSLGLILYEMATGKVAFKRDTAAGTLAAIIEGKAEPMTPLDPSLPGSFRRTVERCLVKEPEGRYASTDELAKELEQVRDSVGGALTVVWLRRTAMIAMVGFLAALFGVVALNLGEIRDRLLGGPGGIQSVAVLPLRNVSGDPEQEYFSDGMTEALITNLGKIGALRVISRTSVMRFKGTDTPLAEIARQLSVEAVVEGSAQLVGQQAGITVRLIDAASGEQLWSQAYQRNLSNLLVAQNDVARSIARRIEIALTPEEEARLSTERAVNPESYQAYLRGMFYLHESTPEGMRKGLRHLHEAVENDPADPFANAGLALGYAILGHGPGAIPQEVFPRAKAAALRALELDDTLAEAYLALGDVKLYYDWDWPGAERDLRRALELNPSLAEAHYHYGWYLDLMGRRDDALAEMKRAQEIDPLSPLFTAWLGGYYVALGQYDDALEEARKALEMNPNFPVGHYTLGLALAGKGMYEEAIAAHKKATGIFSPLRDGLGVAYAQAGMGNEARRILAEMQKDATAGDAFSLAHVYTALEEKDEAFRHLEDAFEFRYSMLPWVGTDPWFRPLRDDPRLEDLLRRMNVPLTRLQRK